MRRICTVVGGHQRGGVTGRLPAVVGLVPGREVGDPRVARVQRPELGAELRGARQPPVATGDPGVFEGDQRLHAVGVGGAQPGRQRPALGAALQRVPADRQTRVADAERLEAGVGEHVGLLLADPNEGRVRGRGRGRGGTDARRDGEREQAYEQHKQARRRAKRSAGAAHGLLRRTRAGAGSRAQPELEAPHEETISYSPVSKSCATSLSICAGVASGRSRRRRIESRRRNLRISSTYTR